VIVVVNLSDFELDSDGGVLEALMRKNPLLDFGSGKGFFEALAARSRLALVLRHRIRALLGLSADPSGLRAMYAAKYLGNQTPVEAGLKRLERLSDENGFAVLVCIIPYFKVPFDRYEWWQGHGLIANIAGRTAHLGVVDLLPLFQSVDNDGRKFSCDGMHLNVYGHEVMAKILFSLLEGKVH